MQLGKRQNRAGLKLKEDTCCHTTLQTGNTATTWARSLIFWDVLLDLFFPFFHLNLKWLFFPPEILSPILFSLNLPRKHSRRSSQTHKLKFCEKVTLSIPFGLESTSFQTNIFFFWGESILSIFFPLWCHYTMANSNQYTY